MLRRSRQGQEVEIELAKNYNQHRGLLRQSPRPAQSTLRLDWAGEKFGFEPLPPDMLFSRKDDADLVAQTQMREGRQLFVERHCGHCHGPSGVPGMNVPWDDAMPRLDEVGYRFGHDWLVEWITNPRSVRPDATMPSVLHGPDAGKQAADIGAYLLAQKNVLRAEADWSESEGERGGGAVQQARLQHLPSPR